MTNLTIFQNVSVKCHSVKGKKSFDDIGYFCAQNK